MPLFTHRSTPARSHLVTLPNELLLLIAENLSLHTLTSLLLVNRHLSTLLSPLLAKYAQRHWHDPDGYPAILRAAIDGYPALARIALEKRPTGKYPPNLEKRCRRGETALHHAARRGDITILRLLLDSGARVNAAEENFGDTALHIAAAAGHERVVRCLLKRGANLDFQNLNGWPPIAWAVRKSQAGVVELLLSRGATVPGTDPHGDTVLHWAAEYGGVELVAALLRPRLKDGEIRRMDVNARNNNGLTPLHLAVQRTRGAVEVARVLVEAGADVDVCDSYDRTPLQFALTELLREYRYKKSSSANRRRREEVVGFLFEQDANMDAEAVGLLTVCKKKAGWFTKFRGKLSRELENIRMRPKKMDR